MNTPVQKPAYNPTSAPRTQLHVECVLDTDFASFSSGRSRLPTTLNAVSFPVKVRPDPKKPDVVVVAGRAFFSSNPEGALVVSLDGDKRQWAVKLDDLVHAILVGDGKYLAARGAMATSPTKIKSAKGAKRLAAKRAARVKRGMK